MKESTRTSRFVELKNYNIDGKGDHFLEVTQWSNSEGFDIYLSRDHQWMSMTWEELTALHAALGDWIERDDICPHIITTDEGTRDCSSTAAAIPHLEAVLAALKTNHRTSLSPT